MSDAENLSSAIALYLGYGIEIFPKENPDRLTKRFDSQEAQKFENQIRVILTELDKLRPNWAEMSLAEAGKWARQEMAISHPELNCQALDALEWAFTWWWK